MTSFHDMERPPGLTDAALLQQLATGARAGAFAGLAERYHRLVHGTARRLLHDDEAARDVAQEVFVRLAREARRVRPETLSAWLHRTARHTALNFRRGEARRRQREETMSQHFHVMTAADATELPDHWADALEHMDAALDGLSVSERQFVLERYHHEQSLREIATRAGKSEDAARMTINRALEKMNRYLRRRGVGLSVTGLAAGLAAELSRAAPPLSGTAAAALTSASLTGAKSSGASAGIGFFTTAIMTKTSLLAGVAALVFLLAVGGGWLVHRAPAPATGEGASSEMGDKNRPVAADPSLAERTPGPAVPASLADRIDRVIARLEALRLKRLEINNRIPRNVDTAPNPMVVDAAFKAMESLEIEMQAVLAELDAASLPDTVAAALKLSGPARDYLISLLFGRWGALDPDKAMAAAKELPFSLHDTGRGSIARGWGRHDPKAALAAAASLNANDETARTSFLREVFTGWQRTDAAAAVRALPDLPVDDQRHVVRAFDDLGKTPEQRAAATSEIARLTDENLRAEIVDYVTRDWARFDGPAAAAWFDAFRWENPRTGLKAAGKLVEQWGRTGDQMEPAMDWFWPKVPAEIRPEVLRVFVAGRWASVHRSAAESWLAEHGIATSDVPDWDRLTR